MRSAQMIASAGVAGLLAFACAKADPQRMSPPETFGQGSQSAPVAAHVAFTPKVDILFVVDNSDSMEKHQTDVRDNISKFVAAFDKDARLDFHIGVTDIFDSRRFGPVVKNFWPLGKLFPIQDGVNPVVPDGQWPQITGAVGKDFVTRGPNYAQTLGKSIVIGVVPRNNPDGSDAGGPEFEEMFSPVMPAVSGQNVGFIRPEAHLAIIMITDADDVSSVSPSQLRDDLVALKGNDPTMVSAFAAISLSDSCPKDPGNRPHPGYKVNGNILEFLRLMHGKAYDLCAKDFGSQLAEAGRMIDKSASKLVKVPLEQIPQAGTLKVTLSGTSQAVPYQYDPYNFTLTIDSSAMENAPADATLDVNYVPVDVRHLGTHRTHAVN